MLTHLVYLVAGLEQSHWCQEVQGRQWGCQVLSPCRARCLSGRSSRPH